MLYAGPWVAERLAAVGDLVEREPERSTRSCAASCSARKSRLRSTAFQASYRARRADPPRAAGNGRRSTCCCCRPPAPPTRSPTMLADPVALNTRLGAYTNFVNLIDLAAIAVPAGFRADGIPFGVTLIGPAFSDGMLAPRAMPCTASLAAAKLGATAFALASTPPARAAAKSAKSVRVAVVGAHFSGQPLNWPVGRAPCRADRDDAHRRLLLPLCPCQHLAAQAWPGVRRHRSRRHRGRDLGDGRGGVRIVRRADPGAALHRHGYALRRTNREGLPLRSARGSATPRTSLPSAAGGPGSPARPVSSRCVRSPSCLICVNEGSGVAP